MTVLDSLGGPQRDYEFLLGLWLNQERESTRKAYGMLRAIRDSREQVPPLEYLAAEFDDPEEAVAIHTLWTSRTEQTEPEPQ